MHEPVNAALDLVTLALDVLIEGWWTPAEAAFGDPAGGVRIPQSNGAARPPAAGAAFFETYIDLRTIRSIAFGRSVT